MGGALVTAASDDVAGSANYVGKVNFRREVDGELRREGWGIVKETGRDDALDVEFPIRLLHQFPSARGESVLIAAAGPTVYRLMAAVPGYAIPNTYVDNTGDNDYWTDHDEEGNIVELRDICPLNEAGKPIEELPAAACWSIGWAEGALAQLQSRLDGRDGLSFHGDEDDEPDHAPGRVALRDLFEKRTPESSS